MTAVYLSQQDLSILAAFENGRDRSGYTIADELDLPAWAVRSTIQVLRQRGYVRRAHGPLGVGMHHITDNGRRALNETRQLRAVD